MGVPGLVLCMIWLTGFTSITDAAAVIATSRRVPVAGVNLTISCTFDVAFTHIARFYKSSSIQGGCFPASGRCGSGFPEYSVTQSNSSREMHLYIQSVDPVRDNGTWTCNAGGDLFSNSIPLSQFASVLDWDLVTYTPRLTSLPSSVTPDGNISISVTAPCADPAAVITWTYQQRGLLPSRTSSSQGSCPSGQVQTTNTLSLSGNTASLYNRTISLTVTVEHDSFDPPTYTRSRSTGAIQFPVPVSSVTLANITSDNEELAIAEGQHLTLTCVTSPGFPNPTVTWSGLRAVVGLSTDTVATSGVLAQTTSTVTATISRADQGGITRCEASNVNGQTSARSKRAILEVLYAPDIVFHPVEVNEGQTLVLTCEVDGRPTNYNFRSFSQYWMENLVGIVPGRQSANSYTLVIPDASYTDDGVYECSVDNGVKDANNTVVQRKRVSVIVNAYPKFTPDAEGNVSAEPGQDVTLEQTFYSSSMNYSSVNWTSPGGLVVSEGEVRSVMVTLRRNNLKALRSGFVVSTVVRRVQPADAGEYVVSVCNARGCTQSSVSLSLAGPPRVPLDLQIVATTSTSIIVKWKPNSPGGDFTQTFSLYYRVPGGGAWGVRSFSDNPGGFVYAEIPQLTPGTVYEMKLLSRNDWEGNNTSPFTEAISSKTSETASDVQDDSQRHQNPGMPTYSTLQQDQDNTNTYEMIQPQGATTGVQAETTHYINTSHSGTTVYEN
ncbi:basement membrane-specific heparan sulfate proteoglycan core protein-like isoform X2 [Haliotis rufescens]|uniref:basement membrane-specific heparan sulfate proteoglycan core protein-like isoform X2 n=1 Tax=Haliotis rufescens TaxID=6454 RepID=UPI00201F43E1|nr:basement membrane-specific heparan sulfate proteoglycan core protein-like isoform X2 [Haliotis rufescens]